MVAERIRQAIEFAKTAQAFVLKDMWAAHVTGQRRVISWAIRILKMSFLVYQNLRQKRFFLRAHALTYWTLISIVPALAVMVIVLKALGGTDNAEKFFWPRVEQILAPAASIASAAKAGDTETAPPADDEPGDQTKLKEDGDSETTPPADEEPGDQAKLLVVKIREYVDKIDSRALGAAGMTVAILTVISLLTKIEQGFNDIWDIERKRTFISRVIIYWGVVTLPAVLLVMSSGLKIMDKSEVILERIRGGSSLLGTSDILNWADFCTKLGDDGKAQQNPGAKFWALLTPEEQTGVALAAGRTHIEKGLKTQIVKALNNILKRNDLHREECFTSANLSQDVKELIEQAGESELSTSASRRLNRSLLAACYPEEVAQGDDGSAAAGSVTRGFLRYIFVLSAFTLLYKIMPNARVQTRSAIVAAIVAGTLWQLANHGYGLYLSWTAGRWAVYRVVYGSLAAVPIFLMWVYLGWAIVLFGAGVAYADQNLSIFEREGVSLESSFAARQFVAMRTCVAIGQAYHYQTGSFSAGALSVALGVPVRIVTDCLKDLKELGYLIEVLGDNENQEATYQPATSLENLKLHDLAERLRTHGGEAEYPMPQDKGKDTLDEVMARAQGAARRELSDLTLLDVVTRAGPLQVPDLNKLGAALPEKKEGAEEPTGDEESPTGAEQE